MAEKQNFESLLTRSLQNAIEDRDNALEAYSNMKNVFSDVDTTSPETMQAALLLGSNVVKLLEQCSRANEQIIKLAQLKEKESRGKAEEDDSDKLTMEDVIKAASQMK